MDQTSPFAWVCIGLILLIVVGMNVGLITFLRYKPKLDLKPPQNQNQMPVNRIVEVLKDPFREERSQLNTLSRLVDQFKEEKKDP